MPEENLREVYAPVLAGLPNLRFSDEALFAEAGMLELALQHQERCLRCGAKTTDECALGTRGWYLDISRQDSQGYQDLGGRWVRAYNPNRRVSDHWPVFRMHRCPGPAERKLYLHRLRAELEARRKQGAEAWWHASGC